MSRKNVLVGIDIGTSKIRTLIVQNAESEEQKPQIIGVGESNAFGIRKGLVVDIEEVANSINESVEQAERMAGIPIESAFVSVGGIDISSEENKGAIAVGRADGEVSDNDITRSMNAAQAISLPNNKEIIHVIPRKYSLDNQTGIKDPIGMSGVRLEADCLIIETSSSHLKNLEKCFQQTGINIEEMVLGHLACELSVLSKRQKELGVVLLNIGGGTTSVTVFEEGELVKVAVIPLGGNNITNDVAIGLRTSIDVAEEVKIKYGSCLIDDINKKETINLNKFDKNEEAVVSRRQVAEIIEARVAEIFELVNKELKKIDRDGMLPAGAVLVGGSSKIVGTVDLAKEILKLPAQNGFPKPFGGIIDKAEDPCFATAVGLICWALENKNDNYKGSFSFIGLSKVGKSFGSSAEKIKEWFKGFLP